MNALIELSSMTRPVLHGPRSGLSVCEANSEWVQFLPSFFFVHNLWIPVSSAITLFLGIGSTLIRLFLRRRRIWWDDAAALLSALCLIVQTAACFIHTIPQGIVCTCFDIMLDYPEIHLPKLVHASQHLKIVEYYLLPTSFYAVIWWDTLSLCTTFPSWY